MDQRDRDMERTGTEREYGGEGTPEEPGQGGGWNQPADETTGTPDETTGTPGEGGDEEPTDSEQGIAHDQRYR